MTSLSGMPLSVSESGAQSIHIENGNQPRGAEDTAKHNSEVPIYRAHSGAEKAVKQIQRGGLDMHNQFKVTAEKAGPGTTAYREWVID